MRRGFTAVEMLIVIAMTAIILSAAFSALSSTYGYDARLRAGREAAVQTRKTEETLRSWLRRAALSTVNTDTANYFVLTDQNGAQELTFTAAGERLPSSFLGSSDLDFETRNERFGPHGGLAEVSFSTAGTGDGASKRGLFLRTQRPADGDLSQGGYQEVVDPKVESISYEFWDGTAWQTEWNTQAMSVPRLPAAVRITYRQEGDTNDRILTVPVAASDATAENPVLTGGSQTP